MKGHIETFAGLLRWSTNNDPFRGSGSLEKEWERKLGKWGGSLDDTVLRVHCCARPRSGGIRVCLFIYNDRKGMPFKLQGEECRRAVHHTTRIPHVFLADLSCPSGKPAKSCRPLGPAGRKGTNSTDAETRQPRRVAMARGWPRGADWTILGNAEREGGTPSLSA